jgi:hypothetical protein
MQRWLLLFFILLSQCLMAQRGYLYVKKNGIKKKATFAEGSPIKLRLQDKTYVEGVITYLKADTVYINNVEYPQSEIAAIIVKQKEKDKHFGTMLLYAGAGTALSTIGMTLANWTDFKTALITSAVIGFGPLLIQKLLHLKRKQYKIGRKYSLQILDLHFGGYSLR